MRSTRRARRKTVTFDERCDFVEFEREEHEDEGGDSRDVFFESDDDQDDSARVVTIGTPLTLLVVDEPLEVRGPCSRLEIIEERVGVGGRAVDAGCHSTD
jgi:hypothetical protein